MEKTRGIQLFWCKYMVSIKAQSDVDQFVSLAIQNLCPNSAFPLNPLFFSTSAERGVFSGPRACEYHPPCPASSQVF